MRKTNKIIFIIQIAARPLFNHKFLVITHTDNEETFRNNKSRNGSR